MAKEVSSTTGFERIPPHDLSAEQAVLGSMLLNKDAIAEVVPILREKDFYSLTHALIYRAIWNIFNIGEAADPITISAELRSNGDLDRVGGLSYLQTLVNGVPTTVNVLHYVKIVQDMAKLRALVNAGIKITQLGYSHEGYEVDTLIDKAQAEMFSVAESHLISEAVTLREILPDVITEIETNGKTDGTPVGLKTGFADLDDKLMGLRPGQMIIVAARPGMGKSTLAMDICRYNAIVEKRPVAFFSLEMNRNELVQRTLSAQSDIFLSKLIRGDLNQNEWNKLVQTMTEIGDCPLIVDDSPNLTMTEIRAKARRLHQQQGIELIVIDYLQLLTSGGKIVESRQQEVSEFSRAIKLLAKELKIPIIAVAQLNRNPEARQDKRPQVADLRESGSLEQDADVILLIHRQVEAGIEDAPPSEIIVGKNRSGPVGSVELMFQGNRARFASLASMAVPTNY